MTYLSSLGRWVDRFTKSHLLHPALSLCLHQPDVWVSMGESSPQGGFSDLPELIKSPLRMESFPCGFLWGPGSLSTCSALTDSPHNFPTKSPQMSFYFAGGGVHGAAAVARGAAPNMAVEGEGLNDRAGL